MSKSTFNALASLAILAAAPMAAQAEMTEMADTDLSAVNGQGLVTGFISGALGVPDPFPIPGFTFVGQTLGAETADQAGDAFVDGVGAKVGFGLLPFTGPIAGLLGFNGRIFDNFEDQGEYAADTLTNILFSPFNFVLNPINRYVEGVNGRFEATVDGAAYAVTEVKGALISNAFAGASQAAGQNGLTFTSRVFGRIAQAQSGLTTQRLDSLAGKYGY